MIDIYLAGPYTDSDPQVMEIRYLCYKEAVRQITLGGLVVFSPIVHFHGLGLPPEYSFWEEIDLTYLDLCREIWVYTISGYLTSVGVKAELEIADSLGVPTYFVFDLDFHINRLKEKKDAQDRCLRP